MAIPIKALTTGALAMAQAMVPDAFGTATLRMGPTVTIDPVSDIETTVWAVEQEVSLLQYSDRNEKPETAEAATTRRKFLVDPADLPDGAALDHNATLTVAGVLWNVLAVELAPGEALVIFDALRA